MIPSQYRQLAITASKNALHACQLICYDPAITESWDAPRACYYDIASRAIRGDARW